MKIKRLLIFFGSIIVMLNIQAAEESPILIQEMEELLNLDLQNEEVKQEVVAELYLQCAALFYAFSESISDERPSLAKLHEETANWYKVVGMAMLTEEGKKLNSQSTYADAFIESYFLNSILEFTETDMNIKLAQCRSPEILEQGEKIVTDLEHQIEKE